MREGRSLISVYVVEVAALIIQDTLDRVMDKLYRIVCGKTKYTNTWRLQAWSGGKVLVGIILASSWLTWK
eukprot:jgi/Picsp_1/2372/NSC_05835-R1_---NA---